MESIQKKQTIIMALIVVLMVAIDQVIKLTIHSHFAVGESYEVTSWFWLCYVENPGMAFGIEWFDKLALTLFRILAVVALCGYSWWLIFRKGARTIYLAMIALIIAGALGNIIDCVCYGPLLGGGDWFYGKVIDMFYFPLIRNSAGEVLFFQPVFNWADSCITCAVIAVLLFFRKDIDY